MVLLNSCITGLPDPVKFWEVTAERRTRMMERRKTKKVVVERGEAIFCVFGSDICDGLEVQKKERVVCSFYKGSVDGWISRGLFGASLVSGVNND